MQYKFVCPKCGEKYTLSIPISEYTSEGHYCEKDNTELERDVTDFAGGAVWKCGGSYSSTSI